MEKIINDILNHYKKVYPNKEYETPKIVLETFRDFGITLDENTIINLAFITWNYELQCHNLMTNRNDKLDPYIKASCLMYVINNFLPIIYKKSNASLAIIAAFKMLDQELKNNYSEMFLDNPNSFKTLHDLILDKQITPIDYYQYVKHTYNNKLDLPNEEKKKTKRRLFSKKNNG